MSSDSPPVHVPLLVRDAWDLGDAQVELLSGGRTNTTIRMRPSPDRDLVIQHLRSGPDVDLMGVMENFVRVTSHLDWNRNVGSDASPERWYPLLELTSARKPYVMTPDGDVWRAFRYRPGRIARGPQTRQTISSIAGVYGRFAAATRDLGGPELIQSTIGFHDLERVRNDFASCRDHSDRRTDLDPLMAHIDQVGSQLEAASATAGFDDVPLRVVHNDTKLSNVLLDLSGTGAIAVLDLDLAMMGPLWHDFGDLMRSACWHDPTGPPPQVSTNLFEAVLDGYLGGARASIGAHEIGTFALAGPRLAFELGLRYLSDHLRDDKVLAVAGELGHLHRGRDNVRLADEMIGAYDALRLIADKVTAQLSKEQQ